MKDYMLLMHADAPDEGRHDWGAYLEALRASGRFDGGSSLGGGVCARRDGGRVELTGRLAGYLKIQANDQEDARRMLAGNPVYEGGGTVEIRELTRD